MHNDPKEEGRDGLESRAVTKNKKFKRTLSVERNNIRGKSGLD